jgi:guanylate kinase
MLFCSVTSRPRGEYETDGENFWFLSEEELLVSLDRDEFMEVRF